jgi:tetratricopeptide (TPR) repeat protein
VKRKSYMILGTIGALVLLTATSFTILGVKKIFDGAAEVNSDPYNQVPVKKVLQESLGLGGNNFAQCQANQDNLTRGDLLSRKAELQEEDKNYKAARELYEESLESYKKYPGLDCLQAVAALSEKANCEDQLGLEREREKTLNILVEQAERAYNSRHQQVARALESLGDLLCGENRSAEALPLLKRACQIRMEGAGMESSDTAYTISQLAHCHLDLKNYKEADDLYKKAIATYQKLDGDGFSEAQQIARENLANSYRWQSRYKDAMDCEMQVLSDLEKRNLSKSYYAANMLTSAASTAASQNDKAKMHDFIDRAEQIARSLDKDEDAAKRAEIYNDIADVYADDESYKNELIARQHSLECFKLLKYPQQDDQEKLANSLVKAGSCALKLKDLSQAKEYFGQALSQARENEEIRIKLRANKQQIQEYLQYIEKDKRAARDATMQMQASELKQILVS